MGVEMVKISPQLRKRLQGVINHALALVLKEINVRRDFIKLGDSSDDISEVGAIPEGAPQNAVSAALYSSILRPLALGVCKSRATRVGTSGSEGRPLAMGESQADSVDASVSEGRPRAAGEKN